MTGGRQHWQGGEAKASFKSGICSETEEQEDASLWQSGEKPTRLFHHKFKSQGPEVGTTAMGQRGRRKVRAVKGRGAFGMASLSPSSKPFVHGGVPWPLRAWVPWAICSPAAGDLGTATKEWQRLSGGLMFPGSQVLWGESHKIRQLFLNLRGTKEAIPSLDWLASAWHVLSLSRISTGWWGGHLSTWCPDWQLSLGGEEREKSQTTTFPSPELLTGSLLAF